MSFAITHTERSSLDAVTFTDKWYSVCRFLSNRGESQPPVFYTSTTIDPTAYACFQHGTQGQFIQLDIDQVFLRLRPPLQDHYLRFEILPQLPVFTHHAKFMFDPWTRRFSVLC
jgi:hypothetical protein